MPVTRDDWLSPALARLLVLLGLFASPGRRGIGVARTDRVVASLQLLPRSMGKAPGTGEAIARLFGAAHEAPSPRTRSSSPPPSA